MLDSLLRSVHETDRRFVVHGRGEETDVERQFASHAVAVDRERLPPGVPEPFLVVEEAGRFAGAIGLDELGSLLSPPVVRPTSPDDVSPGYRVLFEVLDGTVYTAMDRQQLLAVSHEIEDRARRVGTGTLRATFQRLSAFEPQVARYRALGESGLDVHVYGAPDWEPPAMPGVTYHAYGDDAPTRYWVLAFDGGDADHQACGLVGREGDDGFEGFWTDDPDLVARIVDALAAETGG